MLDGVHPPHIVLQLVLSGAWERPVAQTFATVAPRVWAPNTRGAIVVGVVVPLEIVPTSEGDASIRSLVTSTGVARDAITTVDGADRSLPSCWVDRLRRGRKVGVRWQVESSCNEGFGARSSAHRSIRRTRGCESEVALRLRSIKSSRCDCVASKAKGVPIPAKPVALYHCQFSRPGYVMFKTRTRPSSANP
jgi:hypothetical protein